LEITARGPVDDGVMVVSHHRVHTAVHQHLGGGSVVADVHHRDSLEVSEPLRENHREVADGLDLVDQQDDPLLRRRRCGSGGAEQGEHRSNVSHGICLAGAGSASTGVFSARTFFLFSLTVFHFEFAVSSASYLDTTATRMTRKTGSLSFTCPRWRTRVAGTVSIAVVSASTFAGSPAGKSRSILFQRAASFSVRIAIASQPREST